MENEILEAVLAAMKRPIPIVSHVVVGEHPGVVILIFDAQDFFRIAVDHCRQLGLRSMALLVTEEGIGKPDRLFDPFLQIANPPSPSRAYLFFSADREKLIDPHSPVEPVPNVLAEWLHSLPKPTGILCPSHGSGNYLIRCCQALGLRVPEDIAVIGADHMDFSLSSVPTLTSIVFLDERMGFEGMRLLQDWISSNKPPAAIVRLHGMELQVRGSTGLRKPEICDIAGALKCIEENACRGITVEQVIKETQSVSKKTFYNRFQEVVGKSPADAIRDRKLDEVRRLLTTSELPLTMVSDLAGFSSAMLLSRIFRSVEGTTMRAYRKNKGIHPPRQGEARHRPSVKS